MLFLRGKMKKSVSRGFPHSPSLWACGKGAGMGVGSLKTAKSNAISVVFKKCGKCGNNFQETENFMEFQNVFQEMLNVTAAPPAPPESEEKSLSQPRAASSLEKGACAAALQRAGIPTDAPYYAGAFRNVEQALENRKPASRRFWEAYLLSLCGHLERLEREAEPEDKPQERQQLRGGIRTVQAVLYAL